MKADMLVIGAGPAGLNAARVAAQAGVSVVIVDDNAAAGGQIWRQGPAFAPGGRAREAIGGLASSRNVTHLLGTRIVAALPGKRLLAEGIERGITLEYGKLVIATGARERFLPFPGWTLPGVTGAGGLQALVKGGMPVRGQRIVVAGSGPLLWAAAATAREAGARIVAIVEQAAPRDVRAFAMGLVHTPAKLAQAMQLRLALRDTPHFCDAHVIEAGHNDASHNDASHGGVAFVRVRHGGKERRFECDRLACAFGLVPNTTIGESLGCATHDFRGTLALIVDDDQATCIPDVYAAGECCGVGGVELSAVEGRIAAHAALGAHDMARACYGERDRYRRFAARMHDAFALRDALRTLAAPDTILCRCEDVTSGVAAAHRGWRDAKLHTRCGMGPCQGKICGDAAAFCFGWHTGGKRPPLVPARIGTLIEALDDAGVVQKASTGA